MKFILRSLAILLVLYGLVFAIGDAYLWRAQAPLWLAIAFAVGFIGLQFLIGPYLIEWMMSIVRDEDANLLPAANREFVAQLCAKRGMRAPRLGII